MAPERHLPGPRRLPSALAAATHGKRLGTPFFIQIVRVEDPIDQLPGDCHCGSLTTKHDVVPIGLGILDQFEQCGNDLSAGRASFLVFREQ